jgi:hypothetical protein
MYFASWGGKGLAAAVFLAGERDSLLFDECT